MLGDRYMGTTTVGETYSLRLKGLERRILITDTPGILEAGVAGTEREQLARELVTGANLLLFVVDNDLRRSEYEPLRALIVKGALQLVSTALQLNVATFVIGRAIQGVTAAYLTKITVKVLSNISVTTKIGVMGE